MKTLREYILESVQSERITLKDITELKFYEVSDYSELKTQGQTKLTMKDFGYSQKHLKKIKRHTEISTKNHGTLII